MCALRRFPLTSLAFCIAAESKGNGGRRRRKDNFLTFPSYSSFISGGGDLSSSSHMGGRRPSSRIRTICNILLYFLYFHIFYRGVAISNSNHISSSKDNFSLVPHYDGGSNFLSPIWGKREVKKNLQVLHFLSQKLFSLPPPFLSIEVKDGLFWGDTLLGWGLKGCATFRTFSFFLEFP